MRVLACLLGPPHLLIHTKFQAHLNGAEGVDFHVEFGWAGDGDDADVRQVVDILEADIRSTDAVVGAFAERKIGFYKANFGTSNLRVR